MTPRSVRACVAMFVLLVSAAVMGGCGRDDSGASKRRAADKDAPSLFDVAAAELPASSTAMFLRADDPSVDRVERSLRAVAGGRVVLNEMPTRPELARAAMVQLGFDPVAARELGPLARDEVVAARVGSGWKLWLPLERAERARGDRLAASHPDQAAVEGSVLRIATSPDAFAAGTRPTDTALHDVARWREVSGSRAGRAAFVIGVDNGRIAAFGADQRGVSAQGHLGVSRTCDLDGDALESLSQVPEDSALAAAGRLPDATGAAALRFVLDLSTTTVRALAAVDLGSGRVDRIRDALTNGAARLTTGMDVGSSKAAAVRVLDAGGNRPRTVPVTAQSEAPLADDPAFADARPKSGDQVFRAWWLDLDRVIRAAADARLTGLELGATLGLGDGVDGILAWHACDGTFGARAAIDAD